ncbi:MAG: ParB/RepB/Spo0J family partition protein [Elusimicrobiales bacterium]|nr:ParB/RepB/Spo0J family partition protein [Elusimicrobiales bacterium]
MNKKALGRGIDALISKADSVYNKETIQKISIDKIFPNKLQPRQKFDEESILELAQSIKENGLAQPIIVTKIDSENYEIIAGERRYRACKYLGWKEIDAIVKNDITEDKKLKIALIENIQREDLNPVEKAQAYKKLIEMGINQNDIAFTCGKSKSSISNTLRILELDNEIINAIKDEIITEGHARALLQIPNLEERKNIFKRIISEKMSVREVEDIAKLFYKKTNKSRKALQQSPEVYEMEKLFESKLGTRVKIKPTTNISGKIIIEYFNLDDFERIKNKIIL